MTLPFVSCVTPTFGRYPDFGHLLEEAVQSFLLQTYPADRRELIICNDCPQQILGLPSGVIDYDGRFVAKTDNIRILNVPFRYKSLGEKFNAAISASIGDLICPFEDDDISLPGRISQAVRMLGSYAVWRPPQVIYLPKGEKPIVRHSVGVRHHASIFTRDAWARACGVAFERTQGKGSITWQGGYPPCSGDQDLLMAMALEQLGEAPNGDLPPSEWQYVYRWGISDCHVSGSTDHDAFYAAWGKRPVQSGTFQIRPHWREDYAAMVKQAVAEDQANSLAQAGVGG